MNKLLFWEYGTIRLDKFDRPIYTKWGIVQTHSAESALHKAKSKGLIAPVISGPLKQEKNHE